MRYNLMLPIALYLFHHVKLPCTYTLPILSRIFIHFSTCKEIEKKKKERENVKNHDTNSL